LSDNKLVSCSNLIHISFSASATTPHSSSTTYSTEKSTSTYSNEKPSSTYSNENQTHFGFRSVGEEEKKEAVLGVFHSVADSYDLMNDAMSLGIHRVWKDIFIRRLGPGPSTRLLDVAGGTGDIAFRFLDAVGRPSHAADTKEDQGPAVTVCDINKSMLRVGESRAEKLGRYLCITVLVRTEVFYFILAVLISVNLRCSDS
jgi:2-methoxy-6-polyprenyl-1,4-benzoquinol methylase